MTVIKLNVQTTFAEAQAKKAAEAQAKFAAEWAALILVAQAAGAKVRFLRSRYEPKPTEGFPSRRAARKARRSVNF